MARAGAEAEDEAAAGPGQKPNAHKTESLTLDLT